MQTAPRVCGFAEVQMSKTAIHVENEENFDSSSPGESKKASRSKHSETEQRRRSKINERFQILRDLIPENDQKRDKASFLLEVIQYIQFLQEKLQMYEGLGKGWSGEPPKSVPWKNNTETVESFGDRSHLERLISASENDIVPNPPLPSNAQESMDLASVALCKSLNNTPMLTSQGVRTSMLLEPPMFDGLASQHPHGSLLDAEQVAQQSQSHFWQGRSYADKCSIPTYTAEDEELWNEGDQPSMSRIYSQGLLKSLTSALQASGVDMSQTNISMQLDVRKRTNAGTTSTVFDAQDDNNPSGYNPVDTVDVMDNYEHPHKRFRI